MTHNLAVRGRVVDCQNSNAMKPLVFLWQFLRGAAFFLFFLRIWTLKKLCTCNCAILSIILSYRNFFLQCADALAVMVSGVDSCGLGSIAGTVNCENRCAQALIPVFRRTSVGTTDMHRARIGLLGLG